MSNFLLTTRTSAIAAFASISAFAIFAVLGVAPALGQDFEIGKISVCTNKLKSKTDPCSAVGAPLGHMDRRAFRNDRMDFKFTIFGQEKALAYLRNRNYLPVRIAVWRDGIRKDDDIALDISQSDWDANSDALTGEFAEDGQFKWRTFFHINLLDATTFRIEINDAQDNTVVSEGNPARLSLAFGD